MLASLRTPLALALVGAAALVSGCNKRVFEKIEPSCNTTLVADVDVPVARAADILIVVDNSGSMAEEQAELARNFVDPACPIDLSQPIPAKYQNPSPALYAPGGELESCGFIQLIAAFDNDFRVGVITTDVGMGDNRNQFAPTGWGSRPQRGCLQPDADGRKLIARKDLENRADDPDAALDDDLAARFSSTLANIQTFGSAAERGLDAAALFLDAGSVRAPGCEEDLATFRRADAQLVVLFLTDEEDCSHAYGDSDFPDEIALELENAGTVCATAADCSGSPLSCVDGVCLAASDVNRLAPRCYTQEDELSSPRVYADRLRAEDARAKVAIIGGLLARDGELAPAGCTRDDADEVTDACFAPRGSSIAVGAGLQCSATIARSTFPGTDAERDAEFARVVEGRGCTLGADGESATDCALDCCQADPAGRYVEFAGEFRDAAGQSNAFLDSICKESYRDTMLKLAAFIASVDVVKLAEPPAREDLIVVEITRDGASEPERVLQIDAGACLEENGFYYDDAQVQLVFCGDARPRPGDALRVRAPGAVNDAEGCSEG